MGNKYNWLYKVMVPLPECYHITKSLHCARLFICALWSPAGKGLTSWLSFVVSTVSLSLSIGILGQVWYLNVSIPDLCTLTYFYTFSDCLRYIKWKVSKGAKIRNRYNQIPHLTQDTNGKVTNSVRHHRREPRGQSFPSR